VGRVPRDRLDRGRPAGVGDHANSDRCVAFRLFYDNQPEGELEGDYASPVSANDHVLAPR